MKRRTALVTGFALAGSACVNLRSIGAPIHQVYDRLLPAANVQSLLVFLPGVLDYAEDFERFGFLQAVRQERLPIDMVAVDANLRYMQRGLLTDRLHQDVIAPARQRGYANIWLVGISLGGLSAMLYAARHADIDGIVSIAPFLGRSAALEEIARAGGLTRWQPDADTAMFDWERDPHLWLKTYLPSLKSRPSGVSPRLIMGLGLQDRYYQEQSQLAASLPPEDVFSAPGIHDWPVWQKLWRTILRTHGDLLSGYKPQPA
ncbi:MAG: alpha/beta hydrolase-fold protein [Burkholderiaceae bacterium]